MDLTDRKTDIIDGSDVVRILLGYYDKDTGKFVPGIMTVITSLDTRLSFDERIRKYLIWFIAIIAGLQFFGIHGVGDILKLFHGGP